MKHRIPAVCAVCIAALSVLPLQAGAYTVDDVAARARAAGYPEDVIQAGYNEWSSGKYSQDDLDNAYFEVSTYDERMSDKIREKLTGGSSQPDSAADSKTDPAAGSQADPAVDSKTDPAVDSQTDSAADPAATTAAQDGESTASAPDDSSGASQTGSRISSGDFINMTLEEKQQYISSLDSEGQNEFFSTMTAEERNSVIKQLSVDEKAEIMAEYVSAADAMGMKVAVDQITDSNITVTIRNNEGTVINRTGVGVTIEDTGISHTLPYACAAGLGLAAVMGITVISRRMQKPDPQEAQ